MSKPTRLLGTCPFCGSEVRREAVIVEYDINGEARVFVECYECEEPVRPQ